MRELVDQFRGVNGGGLAVDVQGDGGGGGELPWSWFDFEEGWGGVGGDWRSIRGVEEEGWRRVYGVEVDGRVVPFKVLKRGGTGGGESGDSRSQGRPVLVMMHGLGLTIASFRGVSGYLFETHDLVLVDYSGFSLTGNGVGNGAWDVGMRGIALSVWRIVDALGLGKISLAGNSLGGGLCLTAALERPGQVERMVLANPACYPQDLPQTFRIARVPLVGEFFMRITPAERFVAGVEYVSYVDKGKFEGALRGRYLENLSRLGARCRMMEMIRQLPGGPRDCTRAPHLCRLGELRMPVLVSWGEQDKLLAPGGGERLARDLGNGVCEVYGDLAHMPHEEAPERVGPRWSAFLNERAGI